MKLLIVTQKMDKNDPVLGFFHNWVVKLSEKFEKINVICLEKGLIDLPGNIRVFSLGKESGRNKFKYVLNFYKYIWQERKKYDAVFIHMNQEYVLLGGIFWNLLGKKVYFWRNHPRGNLFTDIAVWFSEKVFYTSPGSYTAKFKKSIQMPVGVDIELFQVTNSKSQIPNSILSLGRISPIKNIDKLVGAAILLDQRGVDFELDIVGDPINNEDFDYYETLKSRASILVEKGKINFIKAVSQENTVSFYQTHKIFVNLTPSGSMDKTILEAIGCGCIPIVANDFYKDVEGVVVTSLSEREISEKLETSLNLQQEDVENLQKTLGKYLVENHSLNALMERLVKEIKNV